MIRRVLRNPVGFVLLGMALALTFAVAMLGVTLPALWPVLLRWHAVAIGVLAIAGAIHALTLRTPVDARRPRDVWRETGPPPDAVPPRIGEIERMIVSAKWSAVDFNARLRPVLWEIAAQRLATHEGLDLGRDPAARARLGEAAWTLLAPRVAVAERRSGGVTPEAVRAVVDQLEAIGGEPRA